MKSCLSALLLAACSLSLAQTPAAPQRDVVVALRNADGQPLGRPVKVHLFGQTAEVEATLGGRATDAGGHVALGPVPCGRYDMWVEPEADDSQTAAALLRGLEVVAGDGPQTFEPKLPVAGDVTGRLLLADGKTPAGGQLVAVQSGTAPEDEATAGYARGALTCYAQAPTGDDGSFALHGLAPGALALDIRHPGEARPWATVEGVEVKPGETTALGDTVLPASNWQHLFDGRTLGEWREGDFYGKAPLRLAGDWIEMPMGNDMTGITWTGDIPRMDYEVSLQARRVSGDDFFCGLTFPVGKDYCSLVLGGWGGSLVGISSLDYADASENETTRWVQFVTGQWYRVRVRVTGERLMAWLDGERIVNVATANRKITTRIEMEPSKPFGIATWRTTGAARDIRVRVLGPGEK